jgi:hypothetical protein
MTTIVAIFDNARGVDQAVTRLARAGFEDTVFDEGLLLEKRIVSGSSSLQVSLRRRFGERPKQALIVSQITKRSFGPLSRHLADYRLPDEVIEAYAMTFSHSGEFLLVRTENKRAQAAVEILRNCGATRVARHD